VFRIFRSGPAETVALRGLDLVVDTRELVAIHGPSGSGKTTVMRLAAGLDRPSAGDVIARGRSIARLGDRDLAAYRACEVALVLQSGNLWPHLTAAENIRLSGRLAGVDVDEHASLERFGLASRAGVRAGRLSGGEQQRVAIAAAAARRAPLVLADEPTAELDVANEAVVLAALRELRDTDGATVVVVTHSPRVVAAVDRVVEVRDGRVV
jgi:putative ABC transport system ATP-binding protein